MSSNTNTSKEEKQEEIQKEIQRRVQQENVKSEAYIEIFRDNGSQIDSGTLKYRIKELREHGFDNVVFLGEDCWKHRDIYDILEYTDEMFERVKVFSSGKWIKKEDFRKLVELMNTSITTDYKIVIPYHYRNPFGDGNLYGKNDIEHVHDMIQSVNQQTMASLFEIWTDKSNRMLIDVSRQIINFVHTDRFTGKEIESYFNRGFEYWNLEIDDEGNPQGKVGLTDRCELVLHNGLVPDDVSTLSFPLEKENVYEKMVELQKGNLSSLKKDSPYEVDNVEEMTQEEYMPDVEVTECTDCGNEFNADYEYCYECGTENVEVDMTQFSVSIVNKTIESESPQMMFGEQIREQIRDSGLNADSILKLIDDMHFEIYKEDGSYWIENKSDMPVTVEETSVMDEPVEIEDGDNILISDTFELTFREED